MQRGCITCLEIERVRPHTLEAILVSIDIEMTTTTTKYPEFNSHVTITLQNQFDKIRKSLARPATTTTIITTPLVPTTTSSKKRKKPNEDPVFTAMMQNGDETRSTDKFEKKFKKEAENDPKTLEIYNHLLKHVKKKELESSTFIVMGEFAVMRKKNLEMEKELELWKNSGTLSSSSSSTSSSCSSSSSTIVQEVKRGVNSKLWATLEDEGKKSRIRGFKEELLGKREKPKTKIIRTINDYKTAEAFISDLPKLYKARIDRTIGIADYEVTEIEIAAIKESVGKDWFKTHKTLKTWETNQAELKEKKEAKKAKKNK